MPQTFACYLSRSCQGGICPPLPNPTVWSQTVRKHWFWNRCSSSLAPQVFFFLMCCFSSKTLFISHGMYASIVILSPVGYSTLSPLSYSLEPRNFSGRSLAGVWDRPWLWNVSLTSYLVHSHPCPHSHTSSSSQLYSWSQSLTANK